MNFDCGYETEWWYVIKDEPFSFDSIKSNARTYIRHSLKMCDVRRIQLIDYADTMAEIVINSFIDYKKQYRPKVTSEELIKIFPKEGEYWGVFLKETSVLCGYGHYLIHDDYIEQSQVKIRPEYLKTGANAALVYTVLNNYMSMRNIKYFSNGPRNIVHETNYGDYLIKYFNFRKAYCKLCVAYKPTIAIFIKILFPLQKVIAIIAKHTDIKLVSQVISILNMEEIRRSFL